MSAPSFQKALKAVGACAPLIHVMTNTVSQNDCANLLLAIGARPIMAEAEEEAAEIAAGCAALVLNTGIPSRQKLRAMALAGKAANQKGIPVILDPVGIGTSAFRRQNIFHLLGEVRFSLIRANSAEVCALAGQNPSVFRRGCSFHLHKRGRSGGSIRLPPNGRCGSAKRRSGSFGRWQPKPVWFRVATPSLPK